MVGDSHPDRYAKTFDVMMRHQDLWDIAFVIAVPTAISDPLRVANEIVRFSTHTKKMIVGCMIGGDSMKTPQRILREAHIPNFPDLEDAFRAVGNICQYTCRNSDGSQGAGRCPAPHNSGRTNGNHRTPAILPSYIPAGEIFTHEYTTDPRPGDPSPAAPCSRRLHGTGNDPDRPGRHINPDTGPHHTTTTPVLSATPGATETLPDVWEVEVQVQSNGLSINPQIIMTFRGGKGMNLVPELDLEVIRSDGIVETGKMTQPLYVGETVTLPGTTQNNDRAIVWAITAQGDRVKIVDKYVPFRSYNTG